MTLRVWPKREEKNRHWNISGPTPSPVQSSHLLVCSKPLNNVRRDLSRHHPDAPSPQSITGVHLQLDSLSPSSQTPPSPQHDPDLCHFFFSSPSYSRTTLSVFSAPPSSAFWCKISFLLGRALARQILAGDWMTPPTINRSDFHSHSLAGKYYTAFCGRHIQLFPPFLHLCIFGVWCCPLLALQVRLLITFTQLQLWALKCTSCVLLSRWHFCGHQVLTSLGDPHLWWSPSHVRQGLCRPKSSTIWLTRG